MYFAISSITTVFLVKCAFGANILITNDLPSPSHQIWNYALAEGLMEKGHNITMLGPFTDNGKSSSKYHPLEFEGIHEKLAEEPPFEVMGRYNHLKMINTLFEFSFAFCNHSYSTNAYKKLLSYPKDFKFDLIIFDMTLGPCQFPLIQRFGYPPAIGITAFNLPSYLSDFFGNYVNPSVDPLYFLEYTENMSFLERVINYVITNLDLYSRKLELKPYEAVAKKTFGEGMDSLESLSRRISLLLCNFNPIFHNPQPITPNIIPVGGLHIKPAKKLPQDIQTLMDNAKHGVILFSLGTNLHPEEFTADKKEAFLGALKKLKQTVFWKYSGSIENLPKNVVLRKWLPQSDMFGHPNMKLFITHGGSLSTQEAAYYGIPLLGIPFIVDQYTTISTLVEKKMAVKVEFQDITAQGFYQSINEVLTNPMYADNIKKNSRRIRDAPETPLERAVFWIEYAMRHDGAHFLNPKTRDMPRFVSSCTDVKLFLLTVATILIYSVVFIIKKLLCISKYNKQAKKKLN